VVMERDRVAGIAGGWDLLVSEDLGKTVVPFPLEGFAGPGGQAALHLREGRIFLLIPAFGDSPARGGALVYELDPIRGTFTARDGRMSAVDAVASADGALTSVDFARDRPPQAIAVTRFDPRTGAITRDEVACTVAGCDPSSLGYPFLSGDGDTFDLLVDPAQMPDRSCLLTVRRSTAAVTSECFPRLPARSRWPVSSLGGDPFDFQVSSAAGDPDVLVVPVSRHWLPAGTALHFHADQLHGLGGNLFAFSPSAFTADDTRLLRLRAGGKLQQTTVPHEGCLDLGPFVAERGCPAAVNYQPLPGDELLLITQRDELTDEGRSRQRFEVRRSAVPFAPFSP